MKKLPPLLLLVCLCLGAPEPCGAQLLRGYHTLYHGETLISVFKPSDAEPVRTIYLQKIRGAQETFCRLAAYDADWQSVLTGETQLFLRLDAAAPLPLPLAEETRENPFRSLLRETVAVREALVTAECGEAIAAAESAALLLKQNGSDELTIPLPKKILREWQKILGPPRGKTAALHNK